MTELKKGMRVRAEWFADARPAHLAGVQAKLSATLRVVEGVVTHIRGDHPTSPTSPTTVGVWVMTDAGAEEVVDLKHIVAAVAQDGPR